MDVEAEILDDSVRGSLFFIADESGATNVFEIADGSAHTDNLRNQIKHPLFLSFKP